MLVLVLVWMMCVDLDYLNETSEEAELIEMLQNLSYQDITTNHKYRSNKKRVTVYI